MSTSGVSEWISNQREQRTLHDWIQDLGPFVMLFGLIVIFTFGSDQFLTEGNLLDNVAKNAVTLLLVSLAGTFPILQQSIDLSVESVVLLTGVVTVVLVAQFGLGLLAIPLAIGVGMLAGLFNGLVFTKLKLPSFLVTLGTLS